MDAASINRSFWPPAPDGRYMEAKASTREFAKARARCRGMSDKSPIRKHADLNVNFRSYRARLGSAVASNRLHILRRRGTSAVSFGSRREPPNTVTFPTEQPRCPTSSNGSRRVGRYARCGSTSSAARRSPWPTAPSTSRCTPPPSRHWSPRRLRLAWAGRLHRRCRGCCRVGPGWMHTAGLPGRSAVDPYWAARPVAAARAIGAGLRLLHDALPVADCPFGAPSWIPERRPARRSAGGLPRRRVRAEHADRRRRLPARGTSTSADLGVADRWSDLAVATLSLAWNYPLRRAGAKRPGDVLDRGRAVRRVRGDARPRAHRLLPPALGGVAGRRRLDSTGNIRPSERAFVQVTSVGHAGFLIQTTAGSILCDPWVNPAYFASWFPFPDNSTLDWDALGDVRLPLRLPPARRSLRCRQPARPRQQGRRRAAAGLPGARPATRTGRPRLPPVRRDDGLGQAPRSAGPRATST